MRFSSATAMRTATARCSRRSSWPCCRSPPRRIRSVTVGSEGRLRFFLCLSLAVQIFQLDASAARPLSPSGLAVCLWPLPPPSVGRLASVRGLVGMSCLPSVLAGCLAPLPSPSPAPSCLRCLPLVSVLLPSLLDCFVRRRFRPGLGLLRAPLQRFFLLSHSALDLLFG